MSAFIVFAVVFLAFYAFFLKLRRRRELIMALPAQHNQPKSTVVPRPIVARAGPPTYTCLIDGQQRQYKRGSTEYDLIQDAIRHM